MRSTRLLLLAMGSLLAIPVLAQPPAPHPSPTPTRGMVVFGDLEQRLDTAIAAGHTDAAGKLLSPDFEQRDAAAPAEPLPRAEWLASRRSGGHLPAITQMSVHDYGSLAVVSFISSMATPSSKPGATFLVDVWRNEGGNWRLQVRYQSRTTLQPIEPRRPTGKE